MATQSVQAGRRRVTEDGGPSGTGNAVVLVDCGIVTGNMGTWPAPRRLMLAAPESDMAVILHAFRPTRAATP